jgi:2,3,4,5-tetrahydropyridine-2-carboxylate N-succinyltransferase
MILNSARDPEYLKQLIEPATELTPELKNAVEETVGLLNRGKIRVCEKISSEWITHAWIKKAILFYFQIHNVKELNGGDLNWQDKIPVKKWKADISVRAVPPAVVRYGAFIANGCVLMPSFVNIGAFVDSGSMVDTWATVGSCAQIGKNVHLSGGVGIGGVLEPLQATPVIIEDNAFIGSRCVVVEGVRVGEGAVLGAGVILTQSTRVVDVTGSSPKVSKGSIPANSVVIPGSYEKEFPAGNFHVPCALIIGARTPSTDMKTSLNQALRDFDVSV